jgi:hypothetical protein
VAEVFAELLLAARLTVPVYLDGVRFKVTTALPPGAIDTASELAAIV